MDWNDNKLSSLSILMQVHAFVPITFNSLCKCSLVESWAKDATGGLGRDGDGKPGAPKQDIQLQGRWIPLGRGRSKP